MKKLLAILLSVVLLVSLFAACKKTPAANPTPAPGGDAPATSAPGGDSPASPAPAPGGDAAKPLDIIRVNVASEPMTIDPQLNSSVDGAIYSHHVFEGLYKWEDDGTGNAIIVPGQAESYDKVENADGTITYTFHLRPGIKWSDGKDVTAGDFEYSLRRLANPDTAADYNYLIDGIIVGATQALSGEASPETIAVKAIDAATLEITTVVETAYFTELLAFPALFPVRQDVIEAVGDQWTFEPSTYLGNGPYKMSAWEHNSYINLVKNENYYGYSELGPENIRFVLMDDANAMLTGFRGGELDFIEDMPVDEIPGLLDSGDLTVVPYIGTYYVSFQVQKAPFDNPLVREAFTLAIDRDNIVDNITRTGQLPASGYVPSGIADANPSGPDFRTNGGDWYSVNPADYAANCERARELLAEAGYPGGAGFPTVEYLYNTSANHEAIGLALQADWERELGVSVTLSNQDWGVFLETRKNGEYQIARNGWIADFNDPISFIDMWVTGGGNNDAQYKNPAFDALVAASRSESDPAKRMAILHDAEKLMQDDFMLGPIYFYTQKYMLNPAIGGVYYTPLGYFLFDHTYYK